jgi:hypothetical protein
MDERDFEGTLVLERLARIDKVDDFMQAVDEQNYKLAEVLMAQAGVDPQTSAIVLRMMADPDDTH